MHPLLRRGTDEAYAAALAVRSGLVGSIPPHRLPALGLAFRRYGGLGAIPALAAARYGDRVAMYDERGSITYRKLAEL